MFYCKMCSTEVGYGCTAILFLPFQGMTGAAARRCQVLLDTAAFVKNFDRLVRYYLTRLFLIVNKTVIKQRHYEEIRRNTFSATSRYDGGRQLTAVKYYLTRLYFVKSFNRLFSYYRTCLFISATENNLVKYYLTRLLFIKSFNGHVRYYLTRIFLTLSKTGLSSTA